MAIALATLGTIALVGIASTAFVATGGTLAIGGLLRSTSALSWRERPRVHVADLGTALVYVLVGATLLLASAPISGALILGSAALLALTGLVRIVIHRTARPPGFRFGVAHGLVSLVLGAAIWARWPAAGLSDLALATATDMVVGALAIAASAPAPAREAES